MFHLGKKTGFPGLRRSCPQCPAAASSLQFSDKISACYPGSRPSVDTAGTGGALQVAGLLSLTCASHGRLGVFRRQLQKEVESHGSVCLGERPEHLSRQTG